MSYNCNVVKAPHSICWPSHLPLEIVSYIFKLSLRADAASIPDELAISSRSSVPLTLTWVCSSWRRLALSLPFLWTSVLLGSNGSRPSSDVQILDLFLTRSGDILPLSFVLNYDSLEPSTPESSLPDHAQSESYLTGMRRIAHRLISVRYRWRVLSLHVLYFSALEPFLQSLSFETPILEYLTISTKYNGFFGAKHTLELASCPRLRSVRILAPMIFSNPSISSLKNLKNLELGFCLSQLDAVMWLSSCRNLTHLSIKFYAAQAMDSSPSLLISLPHLMHLSIMCVYGDSDPANFIDALELPSLRSLCLLTSDPFPVSSWRSLTDFLRRIKGKGLDNLQLINTPMKPHELVQTLQCAGEIKQLALGGEAVTDEVLKALTADRDTFTENLPSENTIQLEHYKSLLCPKLELLELHHISASPHMVEKLVVSRALDSSDAKLPCSPLKKLVLVGDKRSPHFYYPSTQWHLPSGLQIVFRVLEKDFDYETVAFSPTTDL
ncbi:hypothetical protein EW145_g4177 [Phellinidium pouzarii]|uniref:F-box domain-containing protein n=1 Tax=Phellinidium pouzarii TaxID=167371 RepID=A0A4S4L4Z4_9AGAM|nr:hypothetical protein EW145_g4177 [Phellinidium pouzarii]